MIFFYIKKKLHFYFFLLLYKVKALFKRPYYSGPVRDGEKWKLMRLKYTFASISNNI